MTPLLKVQNVGKTYGKGANTFTALSNIAFEVEKGEFVGVMGPSGAWEIYPFKCISND